MTTFDPTKHPRGNQSTGHAGQFATKAQTASEVGLTELYRGLDLADSVGKALDNLPDNVALTAISGYLERRGLPSKIWTPDDLRDVDPDLTDEQIDAAMNTWYWKGLEDCTDQDWERVHEAINEVKPRS